MRPAPAPTPAKVHPFTDRIALMAVVLATTLHALALTQGTLSFAVADTQLTGFYDALGTSLLHGRFDVPREAISLEAFVVGGRYYGYFGPTPAFPRMLLDALVPSMRGLWTRTTMTLACFATLLASGSLVRHLTAMRAPARPTSQGRSPPTPGPYEVAALLLAVALGTTLFFIARRPIIYHEAAATGVACALWSYLGALAYFRTARLRWLVCMVGCALLAYLARASVGVGALVTSVLVLLLLGGRLVGITPAQLTPGTPREVLVRHVLVATALLALGLGAAAYRNQRMFGSLTGVLPMQNHIAMRISPERLARIHGNYIQPQNLPSTLWNYLRPDGVVFGGDLPYVQPLPPEAFERSAGARLDWVEPFVSVTATSPLWCLLAAFGVQSVLRRGRLAARDRVVLGCILLGTLVGGAVILVWACISHRFLHDWFPFLVIAGLLGYVDLRASLSRSRGFPWLAGLLVVLGVYSCYVCVATALVQPLAVGLGVTPDVR